MNALFGITLLIGSVLICQISSHGYMFTPINRASRWRLDVQNFSMPHCYEDNQFYCGGLTVQYSSNGGKCGVCGDDYRNPVPRSNENGGTYGNGVVVENYYQGSLIKVDIRLTANHLGNMSFQLCNLQDPDFPESEDCFQPLTFADGSYYQQVVTGQFNITTSVQLPEDVFCDRCVFRWHYVAGNNWGSCNDGTYAEGCGPQETFRSCADISILPVTNELKHNLLVDE
ncbi:hypothetical protein ABEB36_005749 [Hypothenemus hampei]|uniref:Chitin-binding type-4 domain-containing protein n=1 Tax=Hypothenemus hampei TaxID=57062 RepID=A0ABD1F1X8_HYPHA